MEELHTMLEELVTARGIDVAVCVGRDGFVIDSASTGKADTEAIGAMVSTGMGAAESVGRELGLAEMNQTMMEFKNGIIMMTVIGQEALLAIVASNDANLGQIRLQVRKYAPKIVEVL